VPMEIGDGIQILARSHIIHSTITGFYVTAMAAAKLEYLSRGIALVLLLLGLKLVLETLSAYKIVKIFSFQIPVLSPTITTVGIFAILATATCLSTLKNGLSKSRS